MAAIRCHNEPEFTMKKLTAKQLASVKPTNHYPGLTAAQLRETAEGGDVVTVVEEIMFRQHRAVEAGHKLRFPSRKLLEELTPAAKGQAKPEPKPNAKPAKPAQRAPKPRKKDAKHPKHYNAVLGSVKSLLANAECGDDFRADIEALLDS